MVGYLHRTIAREVVEKHGLSAARQVKGQGAEDLDQLSTACKQESLC